MKAGAVGGIEAVVKAISTHVNNVGVCKNGCGALANIIANNGKSTKTKQQTIVKNEKNS